MSHKITYICQQCGYNSSRWIGKCPSCNSWDSIVSETINKKSSLNHNIDSQYEIKTLSSIDIEIPNRFKTDIEELDRVFGGGIVAGSSILIGGNPGVGKSTLVLKSAAILANKFHSCLYVSGEESASQISLRAKRLNIDEPRVQVLSTICLSQILSALKNDKSIKFLVIDSIQTIYDEKINSAPGTVLQVRMCTHELINIAKKLEVVLILLGHVTKEGQIAGPKTLEHMVDTVLYFEGDNNNHFRILRAVKNRFGPANEIGVFEMSDTGLQPIVNPSSLFLGSHNKQIVGSVVFAGIEGSRPLLIEVQALIARTNMATPRRAVVGWDINRLAMIIAVLNARCNIFLGDKEVYLNIAGGLKVNEPAADLAVAVALMSSILNIPVPASTIICGEIALSGEIKNISHGNMRIKEATKLGFKKAIVPANNNINHTIQTMELDHIKKIRKIFE